MQSRRLLRLPLLEWLVEAVKVDAKDQDSARIVALMDELFAIDRGERAQQMDHAQRATRCGRSARRVCSMNCAPAC